MFAIFLKLVKPPGYKQNFGMLRHIHNRVFLARCLSVNKNHGVQRFCCLLMLIWQRRINHPHYDLQNGLYAFKICPVKRKKNAFIYICVIVLNNQSIYSFIFPGCQVYSCSAVRGKKKRRFEKLVFRDNSQQINFNVTFINSFVFQTIAIVENSI